MEYCTLSKPKLKNRDNLNIFTGIVPLISDINDLDGVLDEHCKLNYNYNYLKYALIKKNNQYYFIDAKNTTVEHRKNTDNNLIMCPYCHTGLSPISGHYKMQFGKKIYIDNYFRHTEDVNCLFRNGINSDKKYREDIDYIGETYRHKILKWSTYNIANSGNLYLKMPKSYKLIVDDINYKSKVEFNYKIEHIIKADMEKRILKKDDTSKGLQPDIIFYTESGNRILVEITVGNGKTVQEYYDRWSRLNNVVLELRFSDNKHIDYSPIYDKSIESIKDITISDYKFDDNRNFRFLYDPLLNDARNDIFYKNIELADAKKKECMMLEIEELKKEIEELKSEKEKLKNEIKNEYNINISKKDASVILLDKTELFMSLMGIKFRDFEYRFKDCSLEVAENNILIFTLDTIEQKKEMTGFLKREYAQSLKSICGIEGFLVKVR